MWKSPKLYEKRGNRKLTFENDPNQAPRRDSLSVFIEVMNGDRGCLLNAHFALSLYYIWSQVDSFETRDRYIYRKNVWNWWNFLLNKKLTTLTKSMKMLEIRDSMKNKYILFIRTCWFWYWTLWCARKRERVTTDNDLLNVFVLLFIWENRSPILRKSERKRLN